MSNLFNQKLLAVVMLGITLATAISLVVHYTRTAETADNGAVLIEKNIAYGPSPQETLDICRPSELKPLNPAVVLIHGGGWIAGDKSNNMSIICSNLAHAGIVVANINYRLASANNPQNVWPAQLEDAQLAVRWLRSKAPEYKISPKAICAIGLSAGGHLALFLGALKSNWIGDRSNILAEERPDVACVVDDQGPTDLVNSSNAIKSMLQTVMPIDDDRMLQQELKKASPIQYINEDMVPTLIIQGDHDDIVLPGHAVILENTLKKNHVPVKLITYHGNHNYKELSTQEIANIMNSETEFLLSYLHP